MTYFPLILFVLCLEICNVQGKVVLKKGRIERVSFDGNELKIVVDNSLANYGRFQICFASLQDVSFKACPSGFTGAIVSMEGYVKREFTLNRQGRLLFGKEGLGMGTVVFNKDSTLNITIVEIPDERSIVTLKNAKIFVPEEPKKDTVVTTKKSNASITIVAVVVILLLCGLIVGILVWFCIIRKPKSEQILEYDPQEDSPPSQQYHRSTPRMSSSKKPVKCASNTTMPVTLQTTVRPKQIVHLSSGTKAQSPSIAKSPNVSTAILC